MKKISIITLLSLLSVCSWATEYWVSPTGMDTDAGTVNNPFSLVKAFSIVKAGDIVWVKGGLYKTTATLKFTNAGTVGNYIKVWAVPGETPIIDAADFANGTSTSRGMDIKRDYCHIKGLTIQYAGYNGIAVGASNTIIEGCVTHHCQIDGITLTNNAKNTLVLNCDSYLNWDLSDGNNGDGFSAKRGSLEGNVFRGCRAWLNSDDGWDTYGSVSPVLIDSCWAFRNGFNVFGYTGTWSGNGNGFKLGADGPDNAESVVTNSVTYGNRSKGFDHNHSSAGQTIINCIGYKNKAANFSFYDVPTIGTLLKNVMRNNISYKSTINLAAGTEEVANSWNMAFTITDADFESLDTNLALVNRTIEYKIPETGLFRLKMASPAVNIGTVQTNITLRGSIPYEGIAPELGPFEIKESSVGIFDIAREENGTIISAYPNPFQDNTGISLMPSFNEFATVNIYDSRGQLVRELYSGEISASQSYHFSWDGKQIGNGLYFCVLKTEKSRKVLKLVKN